MSTPQENITGDMSSALSPANQERPNPTNDSSSALFSPRNSRNFTLNRGQPRSTVKRPPTAASLIDNTETVDYSDDFLVLAPGEEWGMDASMIDAAAAPVPTVDDVIEAGVPPETVYGTQPTSRPFDIAALTAYDIHNPAHHQSSSAPITRARAASASGVSAGEKDSKFLSSTLLELQAMFGHDLLAIGSGIGPDQPIVPTGTTRLQYPREEDSSLPAAAAAAAAPMADMVASASSLLLPTSPSEPLVSAVTTDGTGNEGALLADNHSHAMREKTAAELRFLNSAWPSAMRFFLCMVIGIVTAVMTYAVDVFIHILFDGILFFLNTFLGANGGINIHHGFDPTWLVLVLATAVPLAGLYALLAVIASFMGGFYPVVGSGLNHLNAYLNGSYNTRVPIFTFKVLLAKAFSVSLVLASGIKSGLQGPMIHVGALLGRQAARLTLKGVASAPFAATLRILFCCCIDRNRRCRTDCFRRRVTGAAVSDGVAVGWEWLMIRSRARPNSQTAVTGAGTVDAVAAMELGSTHADADGNYAPLDEDSVMTPNTAAAAGAEELGVGANPFSLPDADNAPVDAINAMPLSSSGDNPSQLSTSFKNLVDTRVRAYETTHVPLDLQDDDEEEEEEEEEEDYNRYSDRAPLLDSNTGDDSSSTSNSTTATAPLGSPALSSLSLSTSASPSSTSTSTSTSTALTNIDAEAQAYYTTLRHNPSLAHAHAAALAAASNAPAAPVSSSDMTPRTVSLSVDSQLMLLAQALRNPTDEHDFIVCGASAGFTCAFNAPLAGIIMVQGMIKQAHSWQLTLRMFFCVLVAVLVTNLLDTDKHILPDRGFIDLDIPPVHPFDASELYLCVILGLCGGVGAALFTQLTFLIQRARTMLMGSRLLPNIQYAMFVAAAATFPGILFAVFAHCTPVSETSFPVCADHPSRCLQLACPDGHISEWGSLLFAFPEKSVRLLWDRSNPANEFSPFVLAGFCAIYAVLACASYAVTTPGGLFMPAIILGAALGRTVARLAMNFQFLDKDLTVGVYGALGSVAVLSGVNRLTLPMAVMMVEFTSDTQFLVPIMIVIMLSKFTADALVPSLEAQEGTLRQTYLSMGEKPSVALARATAADVLSASSTSRSDKPTAPTPAPAPAPTTTTGTGTDTGAGAGATSTDDNGDVNGNIVVIGNNTIPETSQLPTSSPTNTSTSTTSSATDGVGLGLNVGVGVAPAPTARPSVSGNILSGTTTPSWWRNVCCVGEIDTLARLRAILDYSPHSAFPVVSVLPRLSNKAAVELATATRRGDRNAVVQTAAKVRKGVFGGDVGVGVLVGVVTRRKLEILVAKGGVNTITQVLAQVQHQSEMHSHPVTNTTENAPSRAQPSARQWSFSNRAGGHLRALQALARPLAPVLSKCPTWTRHEGPVQALMFAHLTRARALAALAKLYVALVRPQNTPTNVMNSSTTGTGTGTGAGASGYVSTGMPHPAAMEKLTPLQRIAIAANALTLLISLPPPPLAVTDAIHDAMERNEADEHAAVDSLETGTGLQGVGVQGTGRVTTGYSQLDDDIPHISNPFSWFMRGVRWLEAHVDAHTRKAKLRAESSIPSHRDEDANEADVAKSKASGEGRSRSGSVADVSASAGVRERRESVIGSVGQGETHVRARTGSVSIVRPRTSSMSMSMTSGMGLRGHLGMGALSNLGSSVSEPAVWVNVGVVAHRDTPIATTHTPAVKLWKLFRHVGMRRMVLVDARHRPVGVVTRKDMIIGEKTLTKKMEEEMKKK